MPPGAILGHTEPYKTLWDHTRSYRIIQEHTEPYRNIRDHTRQYGTMQGHSGPYRPQAIQFPTMPYMRPDRPYRAIWGRKI